MSKLIVERSLYGIRRDRLKRLIELNAPDVVILMGVRLLERCFRRRTFSEWIHDWKYGSGKLKGWPDWLLWLTDAEYRKACADIDKDELRERLGMPVKPDPK
jgi:hypothetical protein